MKIISTLFIALILAGCESVPKQATDQGSVVKTEANGTKIENLSDYAIYAKIATESKPLFEMTCPPTGCIMMSLKVNAPQDKGAIQAPAVPESVGNTFVKGLFGLANNALSFTPWYFGSKVLTKAFDSANASVTTTTIDNSNRSTNSDSSNRSTTNTTNTTTTTTTTTNSNNRNCNSGQAGTGGQGTTTGGAGGASGPATC